MNHIGDRPEKRPTCLHFFRRGENTVNDKDRLETECRPDRFSPSAGPAAAQDAIAGAHSPYR